MRNKEKALELLEEVKYNPNWWSKVKEAIDLASKPDWYYPGKGELPTLNIKVLCVLKVDKQKVIAKLEGDGYWYTELFSKKTNEIEKWMYIPD